MLFKNFISGGGPSRGDLFTEKRPSTTTAHLLKEEQRELDRSMPAATINALKHAKEHDQEH
jgi:hypothetical protein